MILELKNITKAYPGVLALDHVSLSFEAGEVHALMGENGAGKSTLIKTIAGAIVPSEGTITLNGHIYSRLTPSQAKDGGVEVIYQDVDLVPAMSVAENMFMGTDKSAFYKKKSLISRAQEIFEKYGFNLDPSAPVLSLSPAAQELVCIARAISHEAKIIIMDEPTASLATQEVNLLFRIIKQLKSEGVTLIYISHRLDEVFEISDRISILRDGCFIKTLKTIDTNKNELISLMVGRKLDDSFPPRSVLPSKEVTLRLDRVSGNSDSLISLSLHKGEILGISGLVGAGRTELAEMISGSKKKESGKIYVNGELAHIHSPKDAIRYGIGLIPEERKRDGCILHSSVLFNTTLICADDYYHLGIVNNHRREAIAERYKEALSIKVPNLSVPVGALSGGNQQKVVVAKTMAANLDIIIFDEPTKGIDVGAKYEIYELMNELTAEGKSLIVISSDMKEILGISDRIIVLYEGRVQGELKKEEFSQEKVLSLASGEKA